MDIKKKLHVFNVYNLVSLDIGIHLWYQNHDQGNKYIRHLQKSPCIPFFVFFFLWGKNISQEIYPLKF